MSLHLTTETPPAAQDVAFVAESLGRWNVAASGHADWARAGVYLRNADARIVGGAQGACWGGWLHVDILWVEDHHRRQGWGRRLLAALEALGKERGCERAWLDTFSFQAGRRFYEPLGYRVFGELPDHPRGHTHWFLAKEL
ncbi:MAG: GNAT family N-acetyltransferase [bacterium]|nr:GNAT family N-acetyltransferase [bacterium]